MLFRHHVERHHPTSADPARSFNVVAVSTSHQTNYLLVYGCQVNNYTHFAYYNNDLHHNNIPSVCIANIHSTCLCRQYQCQDAQGSASGFAKAFGWKLAPV